MLALVYVYVGLRVCVCAFFLSVLYINLHVIPDHISHQVRSSSHTRCVCCCWASPCSLWRCPSVSTGARASHRTGNGSTQLLKVTRYSHSTINVLIPSPRLSPTRIARSFLCDCLQLYTPSRTLRSASDTLSLPIPRIRPSKLRRDDDWVPNGDFSVCVCVCGCVCVCVCVGVCV